MLGRCGAAIARLASASRIRSAVVDMRGILSPTMHSNERRYFSVVEGGSGCFGLRGDKPSMSSVRPNMVVSPSVGRCAPRSVCGWCGGSWSADLLNLDDVEALFGAV